MLALLLTLSDAVVELEPHGDDDALPDCVANTDIDSLPLPLDDAVSNVEDEGETVLDVEGVPPAESVTVATPVELPDAREDSLGVDDA